MIDKTLIISGDQVMLDRHYLFIDCFKNYVKNYYTVSTPDVVPRKRHLLRETFKGFPLLEYLRFPKEYDVHKSSWGFTYKSHKLGKLIRRHKPDMVLHIFGMSCPVPKRSSIPYVVTLDYTMALAERNYPAWAEFPNEKEREKWRNKERETYQKAAFLFPWSKAVADSLVNDYGISPSKMKVTGSSGNFSQELSRVKTFGSKKILMNASDFTRKGGDIAVDAFKLVKEQIPTAQLQIVGVKDGPQYEGVHYLGHVHNKEEMKQLFFDAEIVLGPALCDPYPGFIIEAMGFGTPCIVSAKDGMPEIVDDGKNGIVLQQLDAEHLASAIVGLLSNENVLRQYSDNAKTKVAEKLNWNQLAKTIVETMFENKLTA